MWEYWVNDGLTVDTAQILNVEDSASNDGAIHLIQYRRLINPTVHNPFLDSLRFIVDTAASEVYQSFAEPTEPPQTRYVPVYMFNAQRGDQWVVYDYHTVGGGGYEMARVVDKYGGVLFGTNTIFLQIHFYGAADSADTLGLSRRYVKLARHFGLVEDLSAEWGYSYFIKGAVINGILYGDTTSIVTTVYADERRGVVKGFELYQNYPNPFNSVTTITFHLETAGIISLVVYDIMGREIGRLVDEESFSPGTHKVIWGGENRLAQPLASGAYCYRLTRGNNVITRSMILLR
jgi:hypothetical protein